MNAHARGNDGVAVKIPIISIILKLNFGFVWVGIYRPLGRVLKLLFGVT